MNTLLAGPARFISFEGIDGCGKSTLLDEMSRWLTRMKISHVTTREPGGTFLGESIRQLLLEPSSGKISLEAEVLLYSASRAQLIQEVILPALKDGSWVLSDRYLDATLAYQGYGRFLGAKTIRPILQWATQGLLPHKTILLDCPVHIALTRIQTRNGILDRIEQESQSFHERVRSGYLELAAGEPERFVIIDGSKPLTEVLQSFQDLVLTPLSKNTHR